MCNGITEYAEDHPSRERRWLEDGKGDPFEQCLDERAQERGNCQRARTRRVAGNLIQIPSENNAVLNRQTASG